MGSESTSSAPATDAGTTRPAGVGTDDAELREQVARQTSSDLKAADAFEREHDGAASDTAIDKASADEVAG